ncbi:hypothetical protein ABZ477_12135 [Microbacterium sp. NPDC019599]|uniref:hypothetical protein n=1 Tax=Microbacterium sp. NPDC019599 TaxID=3154690 RepID=UPI0033F12E2D
MKVLAYAGSEFLTGDAITTALLDYSAALADAGTAGSVEIPVVTRDGHRRTATFLVGPASQIVAIETETSGEELVDDETVERLTHLTRRLHPFASPAEEGAPYAEEYDQ